MFKLAREAERLHSEVVEQLTDLESLSNIADKISADVNQSFDTPTANRIKAIAVRNLRTVRRYNLAANEVDDVKVHRKYRDAAEAVLRQHYIEVTNILDEVL